MFTKFDVGRILNRFSKDVGFLDDLLPTAFTDYLFVSLSSLYKCHCGPYLNFTAADEVLGYHYNSSCCQLLGPSSSCCGDGCLCGSKMVLSEDST